MGGGGEKKETKTIDDFVVFLCARIWLAGTAMRPNAWIKNPKKKSHARLD
jgi:hypothetical protein